LKRYGSPPISHLSGNDAGKDFQAGFSNQPNFRRGTMTNIFTPTTSQPSGFTATLSSIFMTAMIVLVGAVSIAQFAG
jgi:hypothetical protein